MRRRREFILQAAYVLGPLETMRASEAAEITKPDYVCPSCGCASDGKIFDQPGKCPSCGLTLIRLKAGETVQGPRASGTPVEFRSEGAILSGSILLPDNGSPTAAIVLVHGSGREERMLWMARPLAKDGFAVLTYDKRGVGMSGGAYEGGEDNISAANLDLLASDAAAAMKMLRNRLPKIPAGFVGGSQAGWIAPIAAARSPGTKFQVFWSGPVCTTSEQLHFQHLAETDPAFWKSHTHEQVADHMKTASYRTDDVDPRTSLAKLTIPSLWLYGDQDNLVPVDLSIARLQDVIRQGHSNFEYRVIAGYGHNIIGEGNIAPAYLQTVAWIKTIAH
jgi:pimeloyl-ACP methyl ester carboxylesterase